MTRIYKTLLRLYPAEYRALFAEEMSDCFEKAAAECRERGTVSVLCYLIIELGGLAKAVGTEWIARFTHSIYHSNGYIAGRCLADIGLMRPAGIARSAFSFLQVQVMTENNLTDDGEMCVNAHQRFAFASSPRRLLILTCAIFLPMHRR